MLLASHHRLIRSVYLPSFVALALLLWTAVAIAGPVDSVPALADPVGRIVRVTTVPELQAAVTGLTSDTGNPGVARVAKWRYGD